MITAYPGSSLVEYEDAIEMASGENSRHLQGLSSEDFSVFLINHGLPDEHVLICGTFNGTALILRP